MTGFQAACQRIIELERRLDECARGYKAQSERAERFAAYSKHLEGVVRDTQESELALLAALQKCADDADASTAALYWAEQFGVKGIR